MPAAASRTISTHAPAGGATSLSWLVSARRLFLLTPLREGRHDLLAPLRANADQISTHAPAGGATQHAANFFAVVLISTHAPAGGATSSYRANRAERHFYSRPCGRGDPIDNVRVQFVDQFLLTPLREGRPGIPIEPVSEKYISTHAPAGGATIESRAACRLIDISTHAPAGGATQYIGFYLLIVFQFLLTPLREGRRGR